MTDIVEFLTARLDEDKMAAKASGVGSHDTWHTIEWYDGQFEGGLTVSVDVHGIAGTPITSRGALLRMDGEHIARHDPARILAEVKAKRAILALHQISSRPEEWGNVRHHPDQDWPRTNYMGQLTGGTVYSCRICDIGVNLDADRPLWRAEEACETVRWMAAPYAEHPDYKQEWQVA